MRGEPGDQQPQKLGRMGAQRQPQRDMIRDHLLAETHRRQEDGGLAQPLAIERIGEERQGPGVRIARTAQSTSRRIRPGPAETAG